MTAQNSISENSSTVQPQIPSGDNDRTLGDQFIYSINNGNSLVRNLYFTFILMAVYIGVIISSTTDEDLLRISPVNLPLLNAKVPIRGFYTLVPWLLLILHFYLLLQLSLLGTKLRMFDRFIGKLD
jgi:hypothetical protein